MLNFSVTKIYQTGRQTYQKTKNMSVPVSKLLTFWLFFSQTISDWGNTIWATDIKLSKIRKIIKGKKKYMC